MNRKGPSTSSPPKARPRKPDVPDPFRFGWRYVHGAGPDGKDKYVRIPLTLDDVLHPQEHDEIPNNGQQDRDSQYLVGVLQRRLAGNPRALVLRDCLIDWGVRGLRNHSPDVSVFDAVRDPNRRWGIFTLAEEGGHPVLVIEIVSPDAHDRQARENDTVHKVREYYRARVPLYLIVDQERVGAPRQLVCYRRGTRKFVRIPPDEQGRVLLAPVRLLVGLRDEWVVCWDADTGEEIGDVKALERDRAAEAEARRAAEAALAEAQARIRELEARSRNGGGKGRAR